MAFELARAFIDIQAPTQGLERNLARAQLGFLRTSNAGANMARSLGAAFSGIKRFAAIGIGAVAGIAGKEAVTSFAKFERAMGKVGVLLSEQEKRRLPGLTKAIETMSVEFGEGATSLASGLFDIVSAGNSADDAMKILNVSTRLAKAGFSSTAVTADALTTVLNAYKLNADDAAEIADKLFTVQKLGKTDLDRVASSIGTVATSASLAGLSFDELGASIATITAAGISTDEAMVSINALLRAFLKPSKEGEKVAKKYGFELETSALKGEGLVSILGKLAEASESEIFALTGEARAFRALGPLVQNVTTQIENLKKVQSSAGVTGKELANVQNLISTQLDRTAAAWDRLKVKLGENIVEATRLDEVLDDLASGRIWKLLFGKRKPPDFVLESMGSRGATEFEIRSRMSWFSGLPGYRNRAETGTINIIPAPDLDALRAQGPTARSMDSEYKRTHRYDDYGIGRDF